MYYPLRSLREGNWFKLICGASFQYLPVVRNLTLAYALAGVDCIDVAADFAVISAAREALHVARELQGRSHGYQPQASPWLMVSFNDGEDPHFRKAEFDATQCPSDCLRPCEAICPAQAIAFVDQQSGQVQSGQVQSGQVQSGAAGVIDSRCYGCGRCVPVCPYDRIVTRSYVSSPTAIASTVMQGIDAVEIHTQVGRLADFERLWRAIAPHSQLKLVSISCPDGEGLLEYLWAIYNLIAPIATPIIWQADGRPMSGDIGDGATRAAVKLAQKVLAANLPGYVQLAGGTNRYTVEKLRRLGLLRLNQWHQDPIESAPERSPYSHHSSTSRYVSGVAYGSYARTLIAPVLDQLEQHSLSHGALPHGALPHDEINFPTSNSPNITPLNSAHTSTHPLTNRLESNPKLLRQAVDLAHALVSQLKSPQLQEQIMVT